MRACVGSPTSVVPVAVDRGGVSLLTGYQSMILSQPDAPNELRHWNPKFFHDELGVRRPTILRAGAPVFSERIERSQNAIRH